MIPWDAVVGDPAVIARHADIVRLRIDSPGQHPGVTRALLRLGHDDAVREAAEREASGAPGPERVSLARIARLRPSKGRLLAPRQRHLGLLRVLSGMQAALAGAPDLRAAPPPDAVAELFDKRRTSARYRALGIPVPDGVDLPAPDAAALRDAVARVPSGAVYVKLASGSSGAGIAVAELDPRGRLVVRTTVGQRADGTRHNTRRLRRLDDPAAITALLGFLIGEGAQIEAAVPKATVRGVPFDLRILVIGGEPVFVVGRRTDGPITNLHLGGERLDPDEVRRSVPAVGWQRALDVACAVSAAHPGCEHLGVDVLIPASGEDAVVLEANAFGDFLPRLTRDGLSVYRHEIRAWSASR